MPDVEIVGTTAIGVIVDISAQETKSKADATNVCGACRYRGALKCKGYLLVLAYQDNPVAIGGCLSRGARPRSTTALTQGLTASPAAGPIAAVAPPHRPTATRTRAIAERCCAIPILAICLNADRPRQDHEQIRAFRWKHFQLHQQYYQGRISNC